MKREAITQNELADMGKVLGPGSVVTVGVTDPVTGAPLPIRFVSEPADEPVDVRALLARVEALERRP